MENIFVKIQKNKSMQTYNLEKKNTIFLSMIPSHMIFGKVSVKSCCQIYWWIKLYSHLCCVQ